MTLISVVLSGGTGARLWPASRQAHPKPFMKLGGSALLEQAVALGQACGADEAPIVTNQDHLYLTQGLLAAMVDPPRTSYLLEPKGRNTGPAIALAALKCQATQDADRIAVNTTGTHVQIDSHCHKVVGTVGVHDLVVFETRPWGTCATLKEEPGYKVNRITVKPRHSLSLQDHHQRAEHWVLVHGRETIQIGEAKFPTLPGEHRYIPLKETHRITNTNTSPDELVRVEVQCGDYLGEDDIVRLSDTYGRA